MKKILLSLFLLASFCANGQYQPQGIPPRFSGARIAFGRGDTSNFKTAADTFVLVMQVKGVDTSFWFRAKGPYYNIPKLAAGVKAITSNDTLAMLRNQRFNGVIWGDSFSSSAQWQNYLFKWLGYSYINQAVAGEDMPAILTRFLANPQLWSYPTWIWGGRNGFPDTAVVIASIRRMADSLRAHKNFRFYVVSICVPTGAPIGTGDHVLITYINNRLRELFPDNFIDMNAFLISKYNPALAQDVTDKNNGVIPESLRLPMDGTHLNDSGYYWTAYRFVQSLFTALGNTSQYFTGLVNKFLQIPKGGDRNTLVDGLEFFVSQGDTAFVRNYNTSDSTLSPIVIEGSELTAIGPTKVIGAVQVTGNTGVTGNFSVTGTTTTGRLFATALTSTIEATPYWMYYNPLSGGEAAYGGKSTTLANLGLTNAITGSGILGYNTRFTAGSTVDSNNTFYIAGSYGIGTADIRSGYDLYNGINGMPASSGSAPMGSFVMRTSANVATFFGTNGAGKGWLQVVDVNDFSVKFPFSVNPNGGGFEAGGNFKLLTYGAGTLTTDASGNVTATSDVRKKNLIKPVTNATKKIMRLRPYYYRWKPETGYDTENVYIAVTAQSVQKSIPEAVGYMKDGTLTVQDRAELAVLIAAFQEQQREIEALKTQIKKLTFKPSRRQRK